MRDFIKDRLVSIRNKNVKTFNYQYKSDNGDVITMKGSVEIGGVDFTIMRTKAGGCGYNSIMVHQLSLTDKCINEIVELIVNNL